MGNVVSDFAKGRFIEKATLPVGTDSLLVVLLKTGSLPTDNTLKRTQFLSGILSTGTGAGLEATFTNYARKVVAAASITIVVNTTSDVASLDIADQTWNSAGGASNDTLGALLLCYKPASTSLDTAIPILTKHDYSASTTGGNLTASIPSIATAT